MIKILLKLLLKRYVKELKNPGDIEGQDRKKGYISLYENRLMMRNLEKMLIEDTKEMMIKDFLDKRTSLLRAGMFIRTKAIYDKAKELYEDDKREQPIQLQK